MTILLEIVVVAAIVFAAVAFATGRAEGMRPAPPESGEVGLPDGPLDAAAIERTRFGLAFRGYRMAEVDAVLDTLRDEVARRDAAAAGDAGGEQAAGESPASSASAPADAGDPWAAQDPPERSVTAADALVDAPADATGDAAVDAPAYATDDATGDPGAGER